MAPRRIVVRRGLVAAETPKFEPAVPEVNPESLFDAALYERDNVATDGPAIVDLENRQLGRHLCPVCPKNAVIGFAKSGRAACCKARKTVTKTSAKKTLYKTKTKVVRKTVYRTTTVTAVIPEEQTISGQLFGWFDLA
jgi:hypothetical protein